MTVTKDILSFSEHIIQKGFWLSLVLFHQFIHSIVCWVLSNPGFASEVMCSEVQWETGILQVPSLSYWADAVFRKSCESCFDASLHLQVKFLTVSCSLGRFEPQCPDFYQSCRYVVPNNTKSKAIPVAFLSEHQLLPTLAAYPKALLFSEKQTSTTGRGNQYLDRFLQSSFYSIFVLSEFV